MLKKRERQIADLTSTIFEVIEKEKKKREDKLL
jgi:hypothetical protein